MMRELNVNELQEVNGGALAFGAAVGAIIGGASAAVNGGDFGDIVSGAMAGGISGFFGGAGGVLWSAGSKFAGGISASGGVYFGLLPSLSSKSR